MKIKGQNSLPLSRPSWGQLGGPGKEPDYAEDSGDMGQSKQNFLKTSSTFVNTADVPKKGSGTKNDSVIDRTAYDHSLTKG
jgi:hypothetical protein